VKWWLGLAACLGFLTGCNNCEKLTEALCKDLGDDCASWKAAGGPDMVIPGGRGVNKACGMMLDSDKGYKGILLGARGTAVAHDLKKAVAAKDTAKTEELQAKLKKVSDAVKAGRAK
jgi:hypothetical protein